MTNDHIVAHSPSSVWQVPDNFKPVYSRAIEVKEARRLLLVSGQFGVAPNGDLVDGFGPRREQAMDNVEALIGASGMTTENIAGLTYYVTRASDFPTLVDIRRRLWAWEPAPSLTAIVVSGLARPEYLIEIEAVAVDMGEKQ
jgi:enamine deaminase RidA (YjgF/YER057c/UK114 family)